MSHTPPPFVGRTTRRSLLAGAVAGAALVAAPSRAWAAGDPTQTMIDAINAERQSRGVHALLIDHRLSVVAADWSAVQRDRRDLAHNPDRQAQYAWQTSGIAEVVAMAGGDDNVANATRAVGLWMGSTAHRNILMDRKFSHLGAGWSADSAGRFYATVNLMYTDLPAVGQEALGLSKALVGDRNARRLVVVRDDVAADALAASGLLAGDVPLLLTPRDRPMAQALVGEIGRAIQPGANVYLIGGGLASQVEDQVRQAGGSPVRLRGADRYETAALVADEVRRVRGAPWRYLIVNGGGWADAASAGAFAARFGSPVLLTGRNELHRAAREVLREAGDAERTIVGGESVIASEVVSQAGGWRVSGRDRAETSARVMLDMWGSSAADSGGLIVTPGWTGDGWGVALAHASFAARDGQPLLYAGPGMSAPVGDAIRQVGFGASRPASLRFARHVTDRARAEFAATAT